MTRWLRPPELERPRDRDWFDPIAQGARHGLPPALARHLWDRICAEVVDGAARGDTVPGRERFHEVATRLAARRRHRHPDVGRTTRVLAELAGDGLGLEAGDGISELDAELGPRPPGRVTQVAAMAQRWDRMYRAYGMNTGGEPLVASAREAPAPLEGGASATAPAEHPGALEMRQALAALQQPRRSKSPEQEIPALATSTHDDLSRRERYSLDQLWRVPAARQPAGPSAAAQRIRDEEGNPIDAQAARGREATRLAPLLPSQATALDAAVGARMSQLFGVDLTRTEVIPESPAATGATKAITKNGEVHFRAGAYQPNTPEGDRLIAHELAHVVQLRGGRGEREGTRKELEREADRAAALAMRGHPAEIGLRAPSSAAYAFNEGEEHLEDLDDRERDKLDSHPAPAAVATTAEPAKAEHAPSPHAADAKAADDVGEPAAGEHGDAGHDSAGAEADVRAVLPAEDSATAAPKVGGGGAAPRPQKEAPNVAAAKPEVGLSQLRGVRPDKLGPVLGQVHTAAATDVAHARAAQQANLPKQMSTGGAAAVTSGGPKGAKPKDDAAPPATGAAADMKKAAQHPVKGEVPGGEADKQAKQSQAVEQQKSAGEVIVSVRQSIGSWFSSWFGNHGPSTDANAAKMSDAETRQMAGSVDNISTSASGVSTDVGPAPELAMKGEAKTSADKDRADLETKTAGLETQGQADSRAPMGEDHIDPTAPPVELTAASAAGTSAAGPAAALPSLAGGASSEEVGFVAQEQHGAEVDAALAKASTDATAERGKHTEEEARARAESDTHVRELKTTADSEQATAREAAQAEVHTARAQWQTEITAKGTDARKQADAKVSEGMSHVETEQTKANAEAKKYVEDGKQKADQEKQKGEKEAADAKEKGKSKSSGFFGWVASKAKAAFDGIKKAVASAIDACKRAVKAVIDAAKKLAMAAIELARKAIVAAIKAVGQALIAISNVLLAAFPGLKAKFQNAIRGAVNKAVAAVNKLADGLKKAVQKALDLLGAALDKALSLLEKGINAIIDAANAVVQGAIKAAQAVVEALGTWAKLIKDIVAGPGSWISKLGAAVVDGIKNHLWSAFKTAVMEWFKSKVFELLGVGGIILELLLEGGLTKDAIIQMALDALMVAIPAALVMILVEKLVAMIVPAAGALMTIIEGLQAAWGTISRIIAAFAAFMAFLLAVKSGGAGPLFATVLAAAAVVVLDFVATWLLKKLASAARKVGSKLKGLAEKFKNKRKAKKDAKAAKKHKDHDGPDAKKHKDKDDHDKSDKERKQAKEKQDRLDKAVKAIQPQVKKMLQKGVSKLVLQARLAVWRLRYRLSKLTLDGSGSIVAVVNPQAVVDTANPAEVGRALLPILIRVERQVMAANRRQRDQTGQSDQELDRIEAIRNYRMGKSDAKPEGITAFNRNNLAQYFRPGDSKYVTMEAAGRLPSSKLLTLERARGVGNVVGMDLADHMSAQGVPGAANLTQNKNMMAGIGAAKASDMKHFVEQGYEGKLTSSTDPAKVAQAQQKVDDGEQSRMAALGEIFMTLRSALEAKDPSLLASPGSPLTELAQAFDSWLKANLPGSDGKVSAKELRLARMVLVTKLRAFMRSRRGV